MRRFRSGFTYVNVVATLALFLALAGGTVWAASKITSKQIGKGAVKNKNLAKNAVKAKNLAKNSVTSAKIAKNAVKNANVADGAVNFAKLAAGTNVVLSTTTGPVAANSKSQVGFNPPLTVTPVAGQVLTLHLESRLSGAPAGPKPCAVVPIPLVNGIPREAGILLELAVGNIPPPFTSGIPAGSLSLPLGLTQPGVPQTVTIFPLSISEETTCTPDSTFRVAAVVTQAK